jgi:uncharacterized protein (TIGR02231 family)
MIRRVWGALAVAVAATVKLAGTVAAAAPAPRPIAAPIAAVTVYPDRALVTRVAELPCAGPGPVRARLPDLPPQVLPGSLAVEGPEGVRPAVRWRRAPAPEAAAPGSARVPALRAELAAARRQVARADADAARAQGYAQLAAGWGARELPRAEADPERWRRAVEAAAEAEIAAARAGAAARGRVRTLEGEAAALVSGGPGSGAAGWEVEVRGVCPAGGGRPRIALRYVALGASWEPAYEARAAGAPGPVELVSYAAVRQLTGEDWEGVPIALSTARPGEAATPPALAPIVVYAVPDEAPPRLVAGAEAATPPPSAAPVDEGEAESPRGRGIAVELAVPGASRVPADGRAVRLLVGRTRHDARLRLRAIPKLSAAVFRVAALVNVAPHPLLPGRIDVFLGGAFLGAQRLEEDVPRGGRLTIGFGVDERVRADRLVVREVERAAGLFGGARHHQFAYRFELASHLPHVEEVELVDHLPVSELDGVRVVVEPSTTAGHGVDPREGFVSWRLALRPGEARIVDLAFRVEVPGAYR